MLFIGIARATRWVHLSTIDGHEVRELDPLKQAPGFGDLAVRRGGGRRPFPGQDEWHADEEDDADGAERDGDDSYSVL